MSLENADVILIKALGGRLESAAKHSASLTVAMLDSGTTIDNELCG